MSPPSCRVAYTLLFVLLFSATRAQLVANPSFASSVDVTTISLGVKVNAADLPLISCTVTSLVNASDFVNLSLNLSTSGELLCFAPPGRNGSQTLQLDLSGLGRGLQSTLITYYDNFVMSLAPGSPALYRSTGGNNLRLMGNCQVCASDTVLWVQIAVDANSSTMVPMQATLGMVNGSFVFDAIIPYEIQHLENITSPLVVLVSLDGQHFHDSTVRISLKKTTPLRVGFGLFSNVMDFGWSYSCNQGRIAITEKYGRSMETVTFPDLPRTREAFLGVLNVSKPFDLWFYCSGVHYELNRDLAILLPQTRIVTTSGDADVYAALGRVEPELTENFNTCWGQLEEARYLAGIAAGGFALTRGLNEIGYVASLRVPEVLKGLNAFVLGARKATPNITVRVRFIGAFLDPYSERRCAEQFFAEGIRILAQHTSSKEPQLAAQRAGGWAIGSNSNVEQALLGDFVLTTPYVIWANAFNPFVERAFNEVKNGTTYLCGLDNDCVGLARFSPLVSNEIQLQVQNAKSIISSSQPEIIFCGEMKDNKGAIRVPIGQCMDRTAKAEFDWLLDSIVDSGDYVAPLPLSEKRFIRDSLFGVVCGLMIFMLIIVVALVGLVLVKRQAPVMRAASWKFLIIILIAVILSLCAVPLLGLDESRASLAQLNNACESLPWLITLSVLLSFGSLFGKTWRLYRLFAAAKANQLAHTNIKDGLLIGFIVGTAIPGIIICGIWDGVAPLAWAREVELSDEFGHTLTSHGHCAGSIIPSAVLAAYFILLLLVGNYLAFVTRNLPTSFTESRWIAQVLSSVFQCLILYIPLDLLIAASSTEALFLLRAFSLMLINGMLVGFIFAPKLLLMLKYNTKQLEELQSKSVSSYVRGTHNTVSLEQPAKRSDP